MILDLCKRLNYVDSDLSLTINYDGSNITLSVVNDVLGSLYSYSCYDVCEAYNKINEFIECLNNNEKFDNLYNNILEVALEV